MRRTFITRLLEQGVDINTVRQLAGHSDISTTASYDHRGMKQRLWLRSGYDAGKANRFTIMSPKIAIFPPLIHQGLRSCHAGKCDVSTGSAKQ